MIDLAGLPKAELHLHLEGSARWEVMREALSRHTGMELPETPYWLEPGFRFSSWDEFRQLFRDYVGPWVSAPDGYSELIREVSDVLIEQNIRYAEVNFCPNVFKRSDASAPAVLEILEADAARAEGEGTHIRWIAGLNREEGVEEAGFWVDSLLESPVVAGFDLHGTEPGWPAELFGDVFAPVLEAGKKLKIHAGEMVGPESVRGALEIGATQIGHGTSAIRDAEVVAMLRERGAVVESCPSSNERLGNIPTYQDYPIYELESAGVTVTLSSDDALFFGPNLTQEMARMVEERGTGAEDLARWTRNALEVALIDDGTRDAIIDGVEDWLAGHQTAGGDVQARALD